MQQNPKKNENGSTNGRIGRPKFAICNLHIPFCNAPAREALCC
jgi:hypothetical protein